MDKKFTPGPWLVEKSDDGQFYVVIIDGNEQERVTQSIACPAWDTSILVDLQSDLRLRPTNSEANAHLMAAAPDMYEALERAAKCINELLKDGRYPKASFAPMTAGLTLSTVIVALAKARGELSDARAETVAQDDQQNAAKQYMTNCCSHTVDGNPLPEQIHCPACGKRCKWEEVE